MNQAFEPEDPNFREKVVESFDRQGVMDTIGVSIVRVEPGRVELKFPYHPKLTQQHDFIHAGIVSTVLDSACGYSAFTLMEADAAVLTIEFKVNLLAPAAGEEFRAVGWVTKSGRNIIFTQGELWAVENANEKTVATINATMMTVRGRTNIQG